MAKRPPICHIIGGGLSGLACAHFVKHYLPSMYVAVYEANQYLGGKAFSQHDEEWSMNLNNAAHMVLSSDAFIRRFIKEDEWLRHIYFVNMIDMKRSLSIKKNMDIIIKKFCNICDDDIPLPILRKIEHGFNPKFAQSPKFYAFTEDLTQRVINVLSSCADEVHCSCKLSGIKERKGQAVSLSFGQRNIKLQADDKVILALDNITASRLLKIPLLEHNAVADIAYYTSQKIFFPRGVSFVGIRGGVADWIVSSGNLLVAHVGDYQHQFSTSDKLALHVWDEISRIRGVNSGFMPSYRINIYDNASIKLNRANNAKRPDSAETQYNNVFICGDWTMKDYPCTMETAVASGRRAVRTMLNLKK